MSKSGDDKTLRMCRFFIHLKSCGFDNVAMETIVAAHGGSVACDILALPIVWVETDLMERSRLIPDVEDRRAGAWGDEESDFGMRLEYEDEYGVDKRLYLALDIADI